VTTGAPAPSPAVGDCLRGRFDLEEVIGEGGTSTVYRAVDRIHRQARDETSEVAVKVLKPVSPDHQDLIALLHREGRRLRDLVHPNIVRVYDSDFDGAHHYLVMELLRGRTLAQVLAQRNGRPLPALQAMGLVRALASGLGHAHRHGVTHGDLKPGNVFLTDAGDTKILDFGTALPLDPAFRPNLDEATEHMVDRVGAVTPAYASLEMLAGEPRTEADDVFSLAIIAYMVATGQHPYQRRAADEALRESLVPARPVGLSRRRWNALLSGLALRRQDRIDSIEDFADRFAKIGVFDSY